MLLTEQTVIKQNDKRWKQIDHLMFLSKNLYNATLYDIRQHFFATKEYKTYPTQFKEFTANNNPDYRALPTKIAKQTMRVTHNGFSSFFALLKKKQNGEYQKPVRIPKYLKKDGRFTLLIDKESISKHPVSTHKAVYEYIISKKDVNLSIYTKQQNIQHIRFVPKGNHIVQEVVYERTVGEEKADNGRYASVDLGVNNLFALYTNSGESKLYNGRALKSVNHYYNKKKAYYQSKLGGERKTSKRIKKLTQKRNEKIKTELHTASRMLINHLVSNNINTLVIGYNKEWKQEINIGKRNNQNFVNIPFLTFVNMLEYKASLVGIKTIRNEESYTSKSSFLDREKVCKHSKYVGRRTKRGLFKTAEGFTINADVNGAANIMRKVVPDSVVYTNEGILGCRTPRFL